jgi:hypothetical protein
VTGRIARGWRAWVALMDRREPATALALVRIAVACVLLFDFAWIWRLGLVHVLWSPPPSGFAGTPDAWARALGLDGPALWAIGAAALVAIALGAATRVACLVFFVVSVEMARIAPDADRGIDMMLRVAVVILALSRCNARWSIDAWLARRRGRPMPAEISAWPRYLLLLQLVWIYFSGGQNKAGAEWGPFGGFEALTNALADPHTARFAPGWVAAIDPLARVATALTMAFELGAPLYLLFLSFAATRERPGRLRAACNRLRLRWVWLGLGVAFELGIAVTLRLGIFAWGMLALYPVLFLPEELARVLGPRPAR